jgi:chorismate mutase
MKHTLVSAISAADIDDEWWHYILLNCQCMKQLYEVNENIRSPTRCISVIVQGTEKKKNSLILKIMMHEGEKVRNDVDKASSTIGQCTAICRD